MTTPYTPTPAELEDVNLPDDGDDMDASSVNVAFETLADGIAHIVAVLLAPLDDVAALKAIDTTSLANGVVRHVRGQGRFELDTGISATEQLPWIVQPTNGPGRWISSTAHETTRTVYVPGTRIRFITSAAVAPSLLPGFLPISDSDFAVFGVSALVAARSSTHADNSWGYLMPIDEFLVDGATLTSATLRWTPDDNNAPDVMPSMAIARSPRVGAAPTAEGLRAAGFAVDSGGTYGLNVDRDLVYTADQNNVIDKSTYSYAVVIFDERGSNGSSGNTFHSVAIAMTGIPDARRG